jgi:ArsR family transcriptional regulator
MTPSPSPMQDAAPQGGAPACNCVPVTPQIGTEHPEQLVTRFKALAHPVRLRMLELISTHCCGLCVCELEQHFDLTQPTISHHLKLLREAGLIRSRQEGPWVHHYAEPSLRAAAHT